MYDCEAGGAGVSPFMLSPALIPQLSGMGQFAEVIFKKLVEPRKVWSFWIPEVTNLGFPFNFQAF